MRSQKDSAQRALITAVAFTVGFAINASAATQTKQPAPPAQAASAQAAAPTPSAGVMGYGVKIGGFFNEQHKQVARKYFVQRYAKAKDCPDGLERAGKICKAPVEGKYWAVGQSLQKAVATYPLPEALLSQLPAAPQGYEYLRAGEDILLVSKGIHLVVDILPNVIG